MPLIIVTGLPCSGKTHRAQQIAAELRAHITADAGSPSSKRTTVQIVNSHHASADHGAPPDTNPPRDVERLRDQLYNSAAHEKTARAEEFSAIKRAVSKDNIVIADGLNYIKGYRYQLWCEAKAVGTRCCVVHVAAQEEECKRWNRERLRAWGREAEDEDSDGDDDESITPAGSRPERQNKDELGDLMPASHTAIYGDRVVEKASRSRSSSLDGIDGEEDNPSTARANDTMTLKSLYITDRAETDTDTGRNLASIPSRPTTAAAPSTASSPPPPPTSSPPYATSTLNSLVMRYEPPSPFSRWDTPLFTIPSSDASPPTQDIWNALFPAPTKSASKKALSQRPAQMRSQAETKTENGTGIETDTKPGTETATVRPHAATVLPKATGSDALQILESATMDVVKHLLSRARELGLADGGGGGATNTTTPTTTTTNGGGGGGGREGGNIHLCIPVSTPSISSPAPATAPPFETTLHIPRGLALSQPQLQRLRRKYTQMQRGAIAHGQDHVSGRRAVVAGFVEFLDHEWNDDD